MCKQFLLSFDQQLYNKKSLEYFKEIDFNLNKYTNGNDALFFENAREGIHYLMEKHNLKREDEVYISTTSDSSFVSTCVSATIFNYAKLSRIVTNHTKLIYIIHEFGFYNHKTLKLVELAKERNIPVVEDCAHTFFSYHNDRRLGTFGDYSLYSLPKSMPVKNGGLLIGSKLDVNNSHFNIDIHNSIKKTFNEFSSFLVALCEKRKRNYEFLKRLFSNQNEIFSYSGHDCPFVFGFFSDNYKNIYKKFDGNSIEFGRTYNKNWVLLPLNPFLEEDDLLMMHTVLKEHLN